jgi:hypothetical protein
MDAPARRSNSQKLATGALFVILTGLAGPVSAQSAASSDGDEPIAPAASSHVQAGTSNDRLFKVLPNFLTLEHAGQVPPLTAGGKFRVVARGTFDYVQLPWYGFLAGISQAVNSEPGFGQGAKGYGKRYAAYAGDVTIENFMVSAVLPSVFHQDPRFYQSGNGTFMHRMGYALSRLVITRGDSGARQFNVSEVLGSGLSSAISTYTYHPRADRTVSNTMSVWTTQLGYDALTNVVKEFWPDIRRKLNHKGHTEGITAP